MSVVEVINIRTHSSKMNKLRIIYITIGMRARNISIKKWEIYYIKIKSSRLTFLEETMTFVIDKVSKVAKIRNRYNQVPHLTQDTNGKVTNSQLDTTNESKEVAPFPAGDYKEHVKRHAQRHSKHRQKKHKRST